MLPQVNLSIFGKKGKGPGDGAPSDFFSQKQQQQQQRLLVGRLASSLNPLTWFRSGKAHQFDTGRVSGCTSGGGTIAFVCLWSMAALRWLAGLVFVSYSALNMPLSVCMVRWCIV
jgi:hypothetical protein